MKNNPLITAYGKQQRWVNWRLVERGGKKTKIPYSVNGRAASPTDKKTWSTHAEVLAYDPEHIGIVFTPDRDMLGIDIDRCVNEGVIDHKDKAAIRELIKRANTYTELSPSGNGLHLYFALSEPVTLEANRHESFEAYTEGRYFTVTGVSFGVKRNVRTIDTIELLELLKLIGYPWNKAKTVPKAKEITPDTPKPSTPGPTLLVAEIIERMFDASNGEDIEKLYNGDISGYKDDASRADMALLSHLAFWTQKDAEKMEAIWLASPLGNRDKTQTRNDYRVRSIKAAIDRCTEVYRPDARGTSAVSIDDEELGLLYMITRDKEGNKKKIFHKNTENMSRVISRHPDFADTFRFDEYRNIIDRKVHGTWRNMEDWDAVDVQTKISTLFADFANVGKEMVYDAIIKVSYDNTVDSGADYLKSLTWDGTPRLDSWLSWAYHTPNDEYHQRIGANWIKGMVKRILFPGCKFDYVLVLEGEQGIKKSTSLLVLAGALGHVETTMSTETKDFFMQFLGNAIIEFSEGETLSRTEVKRMKAIITVQIDKFRAPYGRAVVPHPRRCVFAMTTNQTEYLKDETGNRRWLPVAVKGVANIEWIEQNREQIFAEAAARVLKGESTWEFPEEEMTRQQNLRRIQDPNADAVINWYMKLTPHLRDQGITVEQTFREAMNSGFSGTMTRMVEMGLADVLKTVLLLEKRRGLIGGIRQTKWYPTDKTEALLITAEDMLNAIPFGSGE